MYDTQEGNVNTVIYTAVAIVMDIVQLNYACMNYIEVLMFKKKQCLPGVIGTSAIK